MDKNCHVPSVIFRSNYCLNFRKRYFLGLQSVIATVGVQLRFLTATSPTALVLNRIVYKSNHSLRSACHYAS